MDMQLVKDLFEKAPWPMAAVIIAFMSFKMGGPLLDKMLQIVGALTFVRRSECHSSIKTIHDKISELENHVDEKLSDIIKMLFAHFDKKD